jgi:hypothetical protein
MARKGSVISVPKKWSNKAGVKKIPPMLAMTELMIDVATLPPPADDNIMFMFTVVGKQVKIKRPSTRAGGISVGRNVLSDHVKGTPMSAGQAPKMTSWINPFSLRFVAAFVNSDVSSDNPDSRKIMVTPRLPMKSSGRMIPPLRPTCRLEGKVSAFETQTVVILDVNIYFWLTDGATLANKTAASIPTRKKLLLTKDMTFVKAVLLDGPFSLLLATRSEAPPREIHVTSLTEKKFLDLTLALIVKGRLLRCSRYGRLLEMMDDEVVVEKASACAMDWGVTLMKASKWAARTPLLLTTTEYFMSLALLVIHLMWESS